MVVVPLVLKIGKKILKYKWAKIAFNLNYKNQKQVDNWNGGWNGIPGKS